MHIITFAELEKQTPIQTGRNEGSIDIKALVHTLDNRSSHSEIRQQLEFYPMDKRLIQPPW